jgi:transcriptional regulator with XRE-family HTH domain
MTQEEVATQLQVQGLDIVQKIISEMELGTYSIRVSVLLALAELYGVSVEDFFEGIQRHQ